MQNKTEISEELSECPNTGVADKLDMVASNLLP